MGRGDQRTKKGKISRGTHGKTRLKKFEGKKGQAKKNADPKK